MPTFVAEKGEFLAVDLGGSQFRAHQVKVFDDGKQSSQLESKFYPTPKEVTQGNGAEVGHTGSSVAVLCLSVCLRTQPDSVLSFLMQLFDYIADCLLDFMETKNLKQKLPLGFTFSFPCKQTKLEEVRCKKIYYWQA